MSPSRHPLRRLWRQIILVHWAALLIFIVWKFHASGLSIKGLPAALHHFMLGLGSWGPLVYIILYMLRPLVLFPAAVMTAAAGVVWGPWLGTVYALIGENLSAAFGFWFARFLGRSLIEQWESKIIERVESHLREHGFLTVLIGRLLYLPFDAVDFCCGLSGMKFRDFQLATIIGILPGAVSFVMFGAAAWEPKNLAMGGGIFLVSLVIAELARRSRTGREVAKSLRSTANPPEKP